MPGFDGSGPMGYGPMTGGGRGRCNPANAGYSPRSYGGSGRGMGLGRGFRGGTGLGMEMRHGFGRGMTGWGNSAYNDTGYFEDPVAKMNMLKAEAIAVKQTLDMINKRITKLEKSGSTPDGPGETDD